METVVMPMELRMVPIIIRYIHLLISFTWNVCHVVRNDPTITDDSFIIYGFIFQDNWLFGIDLIVLVRCPLLRFAAQSKAAVW